MNFVQPRPVEPRRDRRRSGGDGSMRGGLREGGGVAAGGRADADGRLAEVRCSRCRHPDGQRGSARASSVPVQVRFILKMVDVLLKMMDFVPTMMNFVGRWIRFGLQCCWSTWS